jgi:hypothetical protein
MKLGLIDKDEYRQFRYWQLFQKLLLIFASGLSVAAGLFSSVELRRLSGVVAILMWVLFLCTALLARAINRHMVRELPASLQSLLLFSSEAPVEEPRVSEAAAEANSSAGE